MPRPVARLDVKRMSIEALFKRAYALIQSCKWQVGYGVDERDRMLDQLQEVLSEIELRGYQLTLESERAFHDAKT